MLSENAFQRRNAYRGEMYCVVQKCAQQSMDLQTVACQISEMLEKQSKRRQSELLFSSAQPCEMHWSSEMQQNVRDTFRVVDLQLCAKTLHGLAADLQNPGLGEVQSSELQQKVQNAAKCQRRVSCYSWVQTSELQKTNLLNGHIILTRNAVQIVEKCNVVTHCEH